MASFYAPIFRKASPAPPGSLLRYPHRSFQNFPYTRGPPHLLLLLPSQEGGKFFLRIPLGEAAQVIQIFLIHGNHIVRLFIILPGHESRLSFRKGNMVGLKGPSGRRIDIMAHFLGGGGHGRNLIFPVQPPFAHHVFHYHFRHGRTADIAVANKKYFHQRHELLSMPGYAKIGRINAGSRILPVHVGKTINGITWHNFSPLSSKSSSILGNSYY